MRVGTTHTGFFYLPEHQNPMDVMPQNGLTIFPTFDLAKQTRPDQGPLSQGALLEVEIECTAGEAIGYSPEDAQRRQRAVRNDLFDAALSNLDMNLDGAERKKIISALNAAEKTV